MNTNKTLESTKLTKRQLATEYCHGNLDTTIGELSIDQLRVALWRELKEKDDAFACIEKLSNTISKFFIG